MKKNSLFLATFAIVATVMITISCVQVQPAPASGSGVVTNERYGRLSGVYSASLGCGLLEADKAVRAAAEVLMLHQLSRNNQTSSVVYEYKDVYETRISVKLTFDANGQAVIAVKFSKTGDREFSRKFVAAVEEQLRALE